MDKISAEKQESSYSVEQYSVKARVNPILEAQTKTIKSKYCPEGWDLVECVETGFVYLTNPPGYSSLTSEYAWEQTSVLAREKRYAAEPVRAQFSRWVKNCRGHLKRGQKVILEVIQILSKMQKKSPDTQRCFTVVDVGCGEGSHGAGIAYQALYQYGLQVQPVGIEISDYLAGVSHKRFEKYGGFVLHMPAIEGLQNMKNGTADIIILMSFLEHETQPAALMKLCREKLSEDGAIILKVPNYKCWNRFFRGERWCGFRFPDHVNYFDPGTLRLLIKRCGLRIARMNAWDRLVTNDNMWAIITR